MDASTIIGAGATVVSILSDVLGPSHSPWRDMSGAKRVELVDMMAAYGAQIRGILDERALFDFVFDTFNGNDLFKGRPEDKEGTWSNYADPWFRNHIRLAITNAKQLKAKNLTTSISNQSNLQYALIAVAVIIFLVILWYII